MQLIGCLVDVAVFVVSLAGQAGNLSNPFPTEFQVLVLGLYLTIPIASIILTIGKNPDEHFLMLSLILTLFAVALGVVAMAVIFQGYEILTLPLLFFVGYLLNVPAIMGRGIPLSHVWHRKRRGSRVGEYGNLDGMRMEFYTTKISTVLVYALVVGLPSITFLADVIFQSRISSDGAPWNDFIIFGIILVGGTILALTLNDILSRRTGWQEVILDTYENHVLWWYDHRGFLVPVEFRNPTVTRVEGNQIRLSMVSWGSGTDLRFYSDSDLNRFWRVLSPIRRDSERT